MKTFTLNIKSAESWSMESDHFCVENPASGNSRRVSPHSYVLRQNPEDRKIIVSIWTRAVQIVNDNETKRFEAARTTSITKACKMFPNTIELNRHELDLINKY